MFQDAVSVGGVGRLTDQISLGVLAAAVPRDVVDEQVAACGRGARRSGGKLPPHVMVYFAMALALFADEDYEEVAVRLAGTLAGWGCWDDAWSPPTSGGITQARARLGFEPVAGVFEQVAVPVASQLTVGGFLGPWRLVAVDGCDWDLPDSSANVREFGYRGGTDHHSPFPKARLVTLVECGSHAPIAGVLGAANTAEESLARTLWPDLEPGWLLLADRAFFNWADWRAAADQGADLLWRIRSDHRVPVVAELPDGSALGLVINPKLHWHQIRDRLVAAARAGAAVDPAQGVLVRLVEYTVPDRDDTLEPIRLLTTILDPAAAPANALAAAYHDRWEIEGAQGRLKTDLRGPGRVLRSRTPDGVRQEIYGYLLAHWAISALICKAADEAGIDPHRVKYRRTLRIIRRSIGQHPPFRP